MDVKYPRSVFSNRSNGVAVGDPPEYRLTGPRPFVKVPTLKLRGRPQLAKVKPLP
jgi:hypothetical protein